MQGNRTLNARVPLATYLCNLDSALFAASQVRRLVCDIKSGALYRLNCFTKL